MVVLALSWGFTSGMAFNQGCAPRFFVVIIGL